MDSRSAPEPNPALPMYAGLQAGASHATSVQGTRDMWWLVALWLVLALASVWRPLLPIDETRYASVAWEMWARGDHLVPFRNGVPYHHKPPLLFWLIHAGWSVFGVSTWWPRMISPLFAAGTLIVTYQLGRCLWPARTDVSRMAPFILLSSLLYFYFASALMFDVMVTFFVVLGWLGLAQAWRKPVGHGGWVLFTLGLAGGLYSKGPVALAHLLPVALLAPLWMREQRPDWRLWYGRSGLALVVAAALILAWAIPAAIAGGDAYRTAIFWGQTAGRMTQSFAHLAPWWFYLAYLPVMLAPWLLWPACWPRRGQRLLQESGFRFASLAVLTCLVFFSLVSGKRWHYLLPEFPLIALLAARCLSDRRVLGRWSALVPGASLVAMAAGAFVAMARLRQQFAGLDDFWFLAIGGTLAGCAGIAVLVGTPREVHRAVPRIAALTLLAEIGLLASLSVAMRQPYDMQAVANHIASFQNEGRPVAVSGEYHGQWHLAGRLKAPLTEVPAADVRTWLEKQHNGRVVFPFRNRSELPEGARVLHVSWYRGNQLAILGPRGGG